MNPLNKLKNPVWFSASYLTETKPMIDKAAESGAGGIVLKSVDYRYCPSCDRNCSVCDKNKHCKDHSRLYFVDGITFYAMSMYSSLCDSLSPTEGQDCLAYMKTKYPNILRIASIIGRNKSDLATSANILEKAGAQVIELNLTPTIRWYEDEFSKEGGIFPAIAHIRKNITIPLIVKLPPELLDEEFLKELSKNCDGITIMNTYLGVIPQKYIKDLQNRNIEKRRCIIAGNPLWAKVAEYVPIAKKYFTFVSASGGIINPERAKKIMELGASSIQLCSGIAISGYSLVNDILAVIKKE